MMLNTSPPIQNDLQHCQREQAEVKDDRLTECHGESVLFERALPHVHSTTILTSPSRNGASSICRPWFLQQ